MIRACHRALDRWEHAVARCVVSPWASGVLALYGLAWGVSEWGQPGWIGFDGVATLIAVEVALATVRGLER